MAPSRRKSASKAAAAAAARRKWKLGDLVLAKVKGFPAWPATVSDPENFGYSADWKKVVVKFFGCPQIAFCNPADVEEFTEEKKVSLLGKRHGKGADFVRAVKEIIDCFEKSKKQDQVSRENGVDGTNITNGNTEGSLTESMNDEDLLDTVKPPSAGTNNDLNSLTEAAIAAAAEDALHDSEMRMEAPPNLVSTVTPVSTTYTERNKTEVARSRKSGSQRRKPARLLRSSSRIDANKLQNTMSSTINTRSSRRSSANVSEDRSLRRSKRIVRSSDDSVGEDANSLAFVLNDNIEDNDSEIMTVDSDTLSINGGTTIDSGSKPVDSEKPVAENNEVETIMSDMLDFQINKVIIKKKRKPNRKRHNNDILEAAKHDTVASDVEMLKTECVSPTFSEQSAQRCAKDDGDEHLPLVKRARVRMGMPSPAAEEEVTEEEKVFEVPGSLSSQSFGHLSCKVDSPASRESVPIKEDPIITCPSLVSPAKKPTFCETRKNFVDEEAALPPSKRLHRALEAMSANVAEDCERASNCSPPADIQSNGHCPSLVENPELRMGQKAVVELESRATEDLRNGDSLLNASEFCVMSNMETPENDSKTVIVVSDCVNVAEDCERASNCSPPADIQSNGHCPSFMENPELTMGQKAVVELESGAIEDLRNGDSLLNASEFCVMSNMETPENDSKTVFVVSDCVENHSNNSTDPELHRDSFEHVDGADSERLKLCLSTEVPAELDAECPVKLDSLHMCENSTLTKCKTTGITTSFSDDCKTECSELNEVAGMSDCDISRINSVHSCVEEVTGVLPNNDTCNRIESADAEGDESHKKKHIVLAENDQINKRSEIVEEVCSASLHSSTILSNSPVKFSNGGYHRAISYDHVDDRIVSITQCSSSLTDGPVSGARASPPSSSICNISALDNHSSRENNSSSSPDVHLHLEKAKLAGRSSGKGESLSSFEAIIKSLTRTKESIGRATRIAIDCAKLGFATKVVEILARNLESESSSHKKVDLFFLVDSITQCSRGIKGDGGLYPSAIQAFLPRLLLAAAPPSNGSHENHRQCLKVLRVWQERKILPEPIIRHHIRELDALCGVPYPIIGSQRPLRNERAFDDPIREMEGMLVDEYGSNSSIKLPGFCMPPMLKDDDGGIDSDGESFEAVTPEHNDGNHDGESTLISTVEKRSHILEDVDGELEMEDVAPYSEVEITSTRDIAGADHKMPNHQSDNHYGAQNLQQPKDQAPTYAPVSRSPLPLPPPPPPLPPPRHPPAGSAFHHGVHNSVSNGPESKPYSSCQNFNRNFQDNTANQLSRVKPTAATNTMHHRVRENKDFEAQVPREMYNSSNASSFSDRPSSHFSNRASNGTPRNGPFSKGFHLRPPHPAPSDQFLYVQEQRIQSPRDIPPPSHYNRFHTRNAENGNFYRDRGRNKFVPRDNIGECWRPPFQSISGPCYPDDGRMAHAHMSYNGPPREPAFNNNRWNFPPRPMNHRHFNYRPPSEDPVSISNRGPNFWRPR